MNRLTVPPGMPDAGHSAWRVALRRAAHQLFDEPVVFEDPFAVRLLGAPGADALRRTPAAQKRVWSKSLRAFVVARSLYAEHCLAAAYRAGARQYCMLGAGLDTFALRNPWPDLKDGLRVFELDQPAVQEWKQELAARAGLSFAGKCEQIPADLVDAPWPPGTLDPQRVALFAMLGVAPFLPPETLRVVLARIQQFPPGSAAVFDYRLPRTALDAEEQRQHDSLQKRSTAKGEPFGAGWTPEAMAQTLRGFARVEDLDGAELNARYFAGRQDGLRVRGSAARLVLAVV